MSNIKLFQSQQIRSHWDAEREQALTGSERPRKYWSDLKKKLQVEGSEVSDKIGQLKIRSVAATTSRCNQGWSVLCDPEIKYIFSGFFAP